MATRSTIPRVREAARKIAAPFWEGVETAGLDRFFLERLLRALLRRWREDRFARVRQGGLHGDARAELGRVFIDLDVTPDGMPVSNHAGTKAERIVASWTRPPRRTVQGPGWRPPAGPGGGAAVPLEVVLGGPGQGKSTVGRFLVLIHASILLLTAPVEGIVSAADIAHMEAFLEGLSDEAIALPDELRLPVWVELRELVDALLHDDESERDALAAMLRWLATSELREAADVASLETALTSLPWVVVFDGLDEVPPERGRALVRACVAGVRRRFASTEGLLIATSRPQSYDRDVFGGDLVERTLLPLKPARAALYTERFVTSLLADEEGERTTVLKRMRKALDTPSTAALMSNPLLVTIMAAIVMHHGDPSDRRWTLFEQYYHTLYQRETERGTYASGTLRDHGPLISAVHRHIGMSLQARSEDAAGVSALMPEHELRAIIREHLLAGHGKEEAARLTDEILRAAEQRLVLLVQSQEGMYGFELRSFQEFMAAWQLVSLTEAQTDALLRRLAPLAAWQNVVLFAIGHQYATSSPLAWGRSVGLCGWLDKEEDATARLTLPGARLALTMLWDAPYGKASRPRQELVSRALELLRLPPGEIHWDLARRLWEIEPEHLLDMLDKALLDATHREAAWMVLFALPDAEQVGVVADRHWPVERDARRAIVRAYSRLLIHRFRGNLIGNTWLSRNVAADLELAMPGELWLLLAQSDMTGVPWVLGRSIPAEIDLGAPQDSLHLNWSCHSVVRTPSISQVDLQRIPTSSPWAVARAAAMLHDDMSAAQLARALEDLAFAWEERSDWSWRADSPWPLLTCVMAARTADDLRTIAGRLRRGELGDGPRWGEIEQTFKSVGQEQLKTLATSPDPLQAMLVEGSIPPFDSTRGTSIAQWGGGLLERDLLRKLDGMRRSATSSWVQRMVAHLMLALVDTFPLRREEPRKNLWPSVDDLVQLVEAAETDLNLASLNAFSDSLEPTDMSAIITRTTVPLVAGGFVARFFSLHSLLQSMVDILRTTPGSRRLQRALVVLLQIEARQRHAPEVLVEPTGDGLDAWLLRFVSGRATVDDAPTLASLLAETDKTWELDAALDLLAAHQRSRNLVLPVIEALLARPEVSTSLRSVAVQFLADQLSRATINLASPDHWTAAGLPAPPPMPDLPEPPDRPGAQIEFIEISNLRAFSQRFEVKAPAPAGPGQWMVFLGENARGKTTLLRAVAMALASPSDAAAVPSNLDGPLRRDASREGLVRVRTTDGRDLTTTVTGPAGDERVVVASERTARPWVVGYGCRRGSAIGGTDIDNAFVPFRDLDNLFDRPRGVVRASGWLKELQRLAKNNGTRSRMVFEAARAALLKVLLDAENIIVENEVHVQLGNRRQVPLTLLSDGYLTTAGWIVDLMARWLKRNEGHKSIDENFCAEMEGVVLLDEIDLHLHPRWQERVIEDVRTLFPRMTFLATTHHALTLRGTRKGEVFVLDDHDGSGAITAVQRDIPPGTRVDQLITGEWFNRPSAIVDNETRAMLDEHQRLIQAGAKAGDPGRKSLERKLRERLGRYADTSLERLAATIVAQHLGDDILEPSAQEREEVRGRVLKILQRRDAKRG